MGCAKVWGCQPEKAQWPGSCASRDCLRAAHESGSPAAGGSGWHVPEGEQYLWVGRYL